MPSEHVWNVCGYCEFWLQFNSKPNCKCTWISRGHICRQYSPKSSQMHAAVPRLSQCAHVGLQCTACSFSPYHCSWLQGKFSARFVTWLAMPREPPHWWKTKCNVTWQGFKNKESLVCNIITSIPNTKIMYVEWCNWPLFCTLAFINIYMYLKIKNMCVYTYILRKQLSFVNMNVPFLWEILCSVNTTGAYIDNLWTMTKINGGQHRYNL